ncbi:MAG: FAD-linked oxidase C-terminal domain-containing protein [Pseudomonadota bacterium]
MGRSTPLPDDLLDDLRALVSNRLSTSAAVRAHHGKDESYHAPRPPDAVVFPESTEEVRAIVAACRRHRVPIVPFGAGTSVEGQVLATHGGVCVDFTRMDRILAVHPEDLDATVQAGVTREQLNDHLRHTGLFFPIDPGANATLGGMASTRASGTNAVRYGTMRENVLGLTVVTASGRVVRTARRARKSAAGYDLTRLFVGAEGTLGLITEVSLRLHPVPEAISAAVCPFPSVSSAVATVIQTIQSGIPIARSELLDALTMQAVNRYAKTGYREAPTLFLEFHGTEAGVAEQARAVEAIAREHGGVDFQWATRPEERSRLWKARHEAYPACLQLVPGRRALVTDVCVPISRLAECIETTLEDIARTPLPVPLFGHVGDGNFHLIVLVDPQDPGHLRQARTLNHRLVERALALDGTCTGEHGVGVGKRDYLREELGDAVDLMAAIKRALDPDNLFNPGKILPEDAAGG